MEAELTLRAAIAHLEAKSARLLEQEAFHAARERFHRGERERHAAEVAATAGHLEALKASAEASAEILAGNPAAGLQPGRGVSVAAAVARLITTKPPRMTFGAQEVAGEINRAFGRNLKRPATHRLVSIALRRLLAAGHLERVRKGNPHAEALYVRRV